MYNCPPSRQIYYHNMDIQSLVTIPPYFSKIIYNSGVLYPTYSWICSRDSIFPILDKEYEDACFEKILFCDCLFKFNPDTLYGNFEKP